MILPTIRDVARQANVSATTVSCVLNKKKGFRFPQETVDRIHKAVEELGYSANKMIRSIQTGKTNTIGLGYFRIGNAVTMLQHLLNSVHRQGGYDVFFHLANKILGVDEINPREYMDGRIDGLIYNESLHQHASEYFRRKGFPAVVLLKRDLPEGIACSNADYFEIGMRAVKYLHMKGHSRIAHLAGNINDWEDAVKTRDGYLAGMRKEKLEIIDGWIYSRSSSDPAKCVDALEKWMAMPVRNRPTAIFTDNIAALRLFKVISARGMKIPNDISIISTGIHGELLEGLNPKLTCFNISEEKIADYAVKSLISIINGAGPDDFRTPVPYDFIEGKSVGVRN
jgi:LacI family transcriptional regulator